MSYEEMPGFVLMTVGILVLLFTFYEAYVLYNGFTSGSLVIPMNTSSATPNTSTNGTLSQAINQMGQSIASTVIKAFPINAYFGYVLAVLLLGIFANVGYKIAKLGVELIAAEKRGAGHRTNAAADQDNVRNHQ